MTTRELSKLINKHGLLKVESGELKVRVAILDVKEAYGNTLLLVTPTMGCGEKWVSSDRVHIP